MVAFQNYFHCFRLKGHSTFSDILKCCNNAYVSEQNGNISLCEILFYSAYAYKNSVCMKLT